MVFYLFIYLLYQICLGAPHQCAALFTLGAPALHITKQTLISIHSVLIQFYYMVSDAYKC